VAQTVTAILAKNERQTALPMIHKLTDELWEKASAMLAKKPLPAVGAANCGRAPVGNVFSKSV
jgi:hypothetical protein